jgi:hypothetical protein
MVHGHAEICAQLGYRGMLTSAREHIIVDLKNCILHMSQNLVPKIPFTLANVWKGDWISFHFEVFAVRFGK